MEALAATGFWGPRTASVDWCEPNYVYSHYVAEWWNTISSLPIVLSGVVGVYNALRFGYGLRFVVPSALMIFVGCGSIAFHGTLQYSGQVLDELAMVFCVTSYLYLVLETEAKPKRAWLPAALVAYNAAFAAVYVLLPEFFSFFVATFIVLCIVVFAKSVALYRDTVDTRLKPLFWVGLAAYLSAFFLCWIPDNLLCGELGHLNLHAVFHVLSAASTYWFVVFLTQRFFEDRLAERKGWSVVLGKPGSTPKVGHWAQQAAERRRAADARAEARRRGTSAERSSADAKGWLGGADGAGEGGVAAARRSTTSTGSAFGGAPTHSPSPLCGVVHVPSPASTRAGAAGAAAAAAAAADCSDDGGVVAVPPPLVLPALAAPVRSSGRGRRAVTADGATTTGSGSGGHTHATPEASSSSVSKGSDESTDAAEAAADAAAAAVAAASARVGHDGSPSSGPRLTPAGTRSGAARLGLHVHPVTPTGAAVPPWGASPLPDAAPSARWWQFGGPAGGDYTVIDVEPQLVMGGAGNPIGSWVMPYVRLVRKVSTE